MASLNRVTIIGNLGQDAELRYTTGGTAVSTISIATTDTWFDKKTQEKRDRTEWHRVVIWGKTAEAIAEYLVKGKQVYVEGSLQTRKWTDKDGQERYTTEIKSHRILLLGSKGQSSNSSPQSPPDLTEDEIPFSWAIGFIVPASMAAHVVSSMLT